MIALDAHGADGGVDVVVRGGELAGIPVQVFGPPLTAIGNDEDPALAARSRTDASIVKAARAVAGGEADGLVSAGPTGATLAAAVLYIKRIRGVHRPAVAALVPVPGGQPTLLLDVGANVEVRPEHLVQFAYMDAQFIAGAERNAQPPARPPSTGRRAPNGPPAVAGC